MAGSVGTLSNVLVSVSERLPTASPAVLVVDDQADLRLDQVWVQHESMSGILVARSSGLGAVDLFVSQRGTPAESANGIYATLSSSVSIVGLGLEAHLGPDVVALAGSSVALEDVSSTSEAARTTAVVLAAEGATLSVRRAVVESEGTAFDLYKDAEVVLEDLVVQFRARLERPDGIVARDGAVLRGRRWRVSQWEGTGVLLVSAAPGAELEDLHLVGTIGNADFAAASALTSAGGEVVLRRVLVDANGRRGVTIKSKATLEDFVVTGELEFGLRLDSPPETLVIIAKRLEVSVRGGSNLEIIGSTRLSAEDLLTRGGLAGLRISETARVELHRFAIENALVQGILLHDDGLVSGSPSLELSDGRLRRSQIGFSLARAGVDLAELLQGIAFENNVRNIQVDDAPSE